MFELMVVGCVTQVNLKETAQPMTVNENDIVTDKPSLKVGTVVEIRHPATGNVLQAIVNKVNDQSMYTVGKLPHCALSLLKTAEDRRSVL